jgi:tetratricopeptide (TPR) repeat protein
LLIACGGGDKKETTTPKPGAGSGSQSMEDGGADPNVDGPGGSGQPGDPTLPEGGGEDVGSNEPGGSDADPTTPEPPPIVPPNFDADPSQSKAEVDRHLNAAKAALNQATPDADKALSEARAALAIDAANVDAAAYVAFAYYHKKLYDTAELVLDDLMKRDVGRTKPVVKSNANVNYVYGLVYDATNRPAEARLSYETAVQLNPNHASALTNLGVHQLKNSQYEEAQQTFERLTGQFNRNDAVTLTSLGSAYRGHAADYQAGDGQRDQLVRNAESAYKRATQAQSSYGPAYYNLGLLYLDTDPYPGIADAVQRLTTAKQYFDQYKNQPGVDMKLFDSRMKDVDKAIKRAQKKSKAKKTS